MEEIATNSGYSEVMEYILLQLDYEDIMSFQKAMAPRKIHLLDDPNFWWSKIQRESRNFKKMPELVWYDKFKSSWKQLILETIDTEFRENVTTLLIDMLRNLSENYLLPIFLVCKGNNDFSLFEFMLKNMAESVKDQLQSTIVHPIANKTDMKICRTICPTWNLYVKNPSMKIFNDFKGFFRDVFQERKLLIQQCTCTYDLGFIYCHFTTGKIFSKTPFENGNPNLNSPFKNCEIVHFHFVFLVNKDEINEEKLSIEWKFYTCCKCKSIPGPLRKPLFIEYYDAKKVSKYNPYVRKYRGWTPLQMAVRHKRFDLIMILVSMIPNYEKGWKNAVK